MKIKISLYIIILIVIGISIMAGCTRKEEFSDNNADIIENQNIDKSTVTYNGWLKTEGANLKNENGEIVQLKGLSSHGIQWFPDLVNSDNLKQLKETWGMNVFRIAMYTDPNANGYVAQPEQLKEQVFSLVEAAKDLDMYVIVDWHILNDNNPQTYQSQSKEFFNELSSKYANTPNVIYEICNEPNGNDVKWNENVKPYAEDIIATIRNNNPKSLIIVGTPDWCKDLKNVANNKLEFENVVYSCHFYAGSHGELLQEQIDYCIEKNVPVFVSECGITDASGSGEIYADKFEKWINFLSERNISWLFWSFCNKQESSSILKPEYNTSSFNNSGSNEININEVADSVEQNKEQLDINDYLTETGSIVKRLLSKNNL